MGGGRGEGGGRGGLRLTPALFAPGGAARPPSGADARGCGAGRAGGERRRVSAAQFYRNLRLPPVFPDVEASQAPSRRWATGRGTTSGAFPRRPRPSPSPHHGLPARAITSLRTFQALLRETWGAAAPGRLVPSLTRRLLYLQLVSRRTATFPCDPESVPLTPEHEPSCPQPCRPLRASSRPGAHRPFRRFGVGGNRVFRSVHRHVPNPGRDSSGVSHQLETRGLPCGLRAPKFHSNFTKTSIWEQTGFFPRETSHNSSSV